LQSLNVAYFFDWLIDYLRFYVLLKNFSIIWGRHHCWWRVAKFKPMLGTQGLWGGRDLYRATPAVTWDLGFSCLIRRSTLFSRLLRHTRGCGGSILTRILTGLFWKNTLFLLSHIGNIDETWYMYKERSLYEDVHIVMGALSNNC
jgi:hypothetical protein